MEKKGKCEKCGLRPYTRVPWQYAKTPQLPILIVGQAPGYTETITKVPFTGAAGKTLWRIMKEAGLDKNNTHITNICECAPPEDRAPTPLEVELCSEHLKAELQSAKPQLIIALGEVAINALTGRKGVQTLRGQYLPILSKWEWECPVLCMLHPSFIMRQRQWIDIAIKDMYKVTEFFISGISNKNSYNPEFIYNPDPSTLALLLDEMSPHITAIDIETPAQLDVLTAQVIGIAFCCNEKKAVALDFTESGMRGESWDIMKRFLEDPKARKCTQNGQFDLAVLETNGVKVKGLVYDTLLAEHVMHSDLPGNLDSLRSRYTDLPAYKPEKKSMKTIGQWEKQKRLEYNCMDVLATHLVRLGQTSLMSEKQMQVLEEIEIPLIDVCNYMERKGFKVDVPQLALIHQSLAPKAEAIRIKYFAPIGLNPNSPKQLQKCFGITSTGEDVIEGLIKRGHKNSDMLQALLDYRKMSKIVSVYLLGVYERLRGDRIHAHPKIEGTGTGRLSYKNPNLQNVPEKLRVIYIPDSPDYVILNGDYNQLELRVGANIAPEPLMLQEFAEGKSTHKVMGYNIFNKEWDDLTAQQKLQAKAVVFGTFYGRSARSIAIEFGVSVSTAEHWQTLCIKRYPGLGLYLQKQAQEFNQMHKCITPFGRVRSLQTIMQAYNTPIQSSASDITLTSLIELYRKGFDLRTTVHDSIVIQAPKKDMMDVAREMKRIMERPIPQLNNYQFPIKLKAGDDWYNVEEVTL